MTEFREFLQNHIILLDGAMGTVLQKMGLGKGVLPETLNMTAPDTITGIHKAYLNAGANVISTNTFGANSLKFPETELRDVIFHAVNNARSAASQIAGGQNKYVALDIGPTGKMLKPLGDLDFEDAVEIFAKTVRLGAQAGVDLIFIETMNDSYETKAALLAAKENCDLPVIVSNAYGADGKLLTGASPAVMVAMLEGMGADAIGVNCSLGPKALKPVVDEYLRLSSVPVLVKPNAGLPQVHNGETTYDVKETEFANDVSAMVKAGVRLAGGCCGTSPEYIAALKEKTAFLSPLPITKKNRTVVASYAATAVFGKKPLLIGERINPTGKKRFKQAIIASDMGYILNEGVRQQEHGVHILDVNVGLPEIDETAFLRNTVTELQSVTELPLQIDTASPAAMEAALRVYNGKAMINSVNGKENTMRAIFPLVKKYGGVVVGLTLDENGIPESAAERTLIAKKIIAAAQSYGIEKKDIFIDPLCMAVSAAPNAGAETLKAVERITNELGCKTVLGVSNVSFGLPDRPRLNSAFFTAAMTKGLSAAIMNPFSDEMMSAYCSFCAISGADENFADYIAFTAAHPLQNETNRIKQIDSAIPADKPETELCPPLQNAIIKGLRLEAAQQASLLLNSRNALQIINEDIIPALNRVGVSFEQKKIFLPQLLMSAEAAAAAFESIKSAEIESGTPTEQRCPIVLLTVEGDIHDIGKNIVKLLLSNFGFAVHDLGKDVTPAAALSAVKELHAPLVGLSALMTTTVPAMRETITLIHKEAPWCKVIVGGAVLTESYAVEIGADKYAPDAMEAVRYAEQIDALTKSQAHKNKD